MVKTLIGNKKLSNRGMTKVIKELYFKYHGRLVLYANKYVHDMELAQDIVQEAFVGLWKQSETFTFNGHTKAYLFQIVKNKSLNYLRDRKKLSAVNDDPDSIFRNVEQDYLTNADNPFNSLLEVEIKEKMTDVFKNLPEGCQQVFALSRDEGLKNREIAKKLGISIKMVEKQISKALRIFRVELAEYLMLFMVYLMH